MESREQAMERARQAIDRAAEATENYQGSCRNCAHYRVGMAQDWCVSPIVSAVAMREDQGYRRDRFREPDFQRGNGPGYNERPLCGPNGYLFEEKPNRSLWQWLKNWFLS